MTYVFDACALIAFLNEEKGAGYETVSGLLDQAGAGEIDICMNIVNLVEVYYGCIREKGIAEADRIMQNVTDLPIAIIHSITAAVYREAARFKALSLADAFLCATAKSLNAVIVTKDSEIEEAEQAEPLAVFWIKRQ